MHAVSNPQKSYRVSTTSTVERARFINVWLERDFMEVN